MAAVAAAAKPKLTYFNGRGRAEIARLLLAEAKIAYDDIRVEGKDWPAIKDKQPFQQLPSLQVGSALFAQSNAIERYVARVGKLYGANELEAAAIDQVVEGIADTLVKYRATRDEKDAKVKAEKQETYLKEDFPKWAGFLEALLKSNNGGAGYFVGNGVTYADIGFYANFFGLLEAHPTALKNFPLLAALYKRVAERPNIAAWVAARPNTPF